MLRRPRPVALSAVKDRMDDFAYDELSCFLDDGVTDENGAMYRSENQRLRTAIETHREAVKCCEECAAAVQADASSHDGRLWAALDASVTPPAPTTGETDQ